MDQLAQVDILPVGKISWRFRFLQESIFQHGRRVWHRIRIFREAGKWEAGGRFASPQGRA